VTLELRFFAWLRERVGESSETVETDAATVAELVEELKAADPRYALAFADLRAVRVAVDQELADLAAPLEGVREVAFFPPMTGG
jgi:sulfur-carrier protein